MKTDTYTRIVLTVIAVCLVWIAIGGPALIPRVEAQSSPQSVIIAGWKGEVGASHIQQLSLSPLPTSK
jgi:hypothetical protein